MASTHQYLDIIIQDDMKYDIRLENAQMERYFLQKLVSPSDITFRHFSAQLLTST